ncbi:MAG: MBL fold metallo-hydrolase [Promethearchaeota archaeon]|nr:MAG: MBL fold metallo-hydrolase [Candidatus Lokiarchaeota archaeon]
MLVWKELIDGICLVKEDSSRVNILNSLVIEPKNHANILIDTNYPFDDIDNLYSEIGKVEFLLFSHGHLDHTAHAFYHQKKYKTPIYIPVQESEYITNIETLSDKIGFKMLNLEDKYLMMIKKYMKFDLCNNVNSYNPGEDNFQSRNFIINTIHIPGHSPGHTAFSIKSKDEDSKAILYVSDIGSHPYYGDLSSNLTEYRKSIDKLEKIYLNGEYILIPAHGTYYLDKDKDFFNRIRDKIDSNEMKIIDSLNSHNYKSIKEIVEQRILTSADKIFEPIKELYYIWDGGMILNHLDELYEKNIVEKIKGNTFLDNKYKLN